jgi:hypothetical protein
LESFTAEDLARVRELIATYRALDIGLADAAVVTTAERLKIPRILTVDERDFRAIPPEARALHVTASGREGISTYLNGSIYAGKWEPAQQRVCGMLGR